MEISKKKFNMLKTPKKPMFISRLISQLMPLLFDSTKTVIEKHGFKDFKEPSLIICTHESMRDFGNLVKATRWRNPVYVAAVEEFRRRELLLRMGGTIPKIKWTNDSLLLKRMYRAIHTYKCNVAMFPEAKWSACGITEQFSQAIGKSAKFLKCRVLLMVGRGNYLYNPFWQYDQFKNKDLVSHCDFYQICSKEECLNMSADDIQKLINEHMQYDEYKWQSDNHIEIKSDNHLQDVEGIIYKCPDCGGFATWESHGNIMTCKKCGLSYQMNDYGELIKLSGKTEMKYLSDLYRYEKEETKKEIYNGSYHYEADCDLSYFMSGHDGYQPIGKCHFIHDCNGLKFEGELFDGTKISQFKAPIEQESIHLAPNFYGKGEVIDISTKEDMFLLYPTSTKGGVWKIMHAVEAAYVKAQEDLKNK